MDKKQEPDHNCWAHCFDIFRKDIFGISELIKGLPEWITIFYGVLGAAGILAGALLALRLMKRKKKPQYTFFGSSKRYSLLIVAIPLILITAFGLNNNSGINQHLFGFIVAISIMVYCYFEEIGWRGYLHDELQSIKQWQRVLIIGFLWWFWHLDFYGNFYLINDLIILGIFIASAWGLGVLIERTKSVLTVSAAHMVVNIIVFSPFVSGGMTQNQLFTILAISVTLWIVIIFLWEKKKQI